MDTSLILSSEKEFLDFFSAPLKKWSIVIPALNILWKKKVIFLECASSHFVMENVGGLVL